MINWINEFYRKVTILNKFGFNLQDYRYIDGLPLNLFFVRKNFIN